MRDVTNYPLSANQRKEVEEFMNKHNITENAARYVLGYVPGDLPQVSIEEAFDMVKKENPNLELSYKTMDIWVDEVMKRAIPKPKPNPKCVRKWIDTVGMLCFEPSIFPPPAKLPFEIKYKYSPHPLVQHFCKIIGTNGYMKFNTGGCKNPRGWSSYSFFKNGEEPTSERVEFDIQPLNWYLQPIGETIHYEGIIVSRQEEIEDMIVLETKRTNI